MSTKRKAKGTDASLHTPCHGGATAGKQPMNCVACDGALSFFGPRLDYEYFRCNDCGTIQLNPQPTSQYLKKAYAAYSTSGHLADNPEVASKIQRNHYDAIVQVLMDYEVKGTVLDYGTGWGGLLQLIKEKGFDCRGVDLEQEEVAYCQARGLPVEYGDLSSVKNDSFAAVTLCTVFEHLVEHGKWLDSLNPLVQMNGLLVALHPTSKAADILGMAVRLGKRERPLPELYRLFSPPWHTTLFSIEGMKNLLAGHGFELVEIRYTRSSREPGFLQLVQMVYERMNRLGWFLMGARWPLQVAHLFVFRKAREV